MALLLVLVVLLASTGESHAGPSQDLDKGRSYFRSKDWPSAIPVLNGLLYPEVLLGQTNDVVEAYLLLGGALYESGNSERARREFEKALLKDPDRSLSTLTHSEGSVRLFEDVKADLKVRAARDAKIKAIAEYNERVKKWRESVFAYEVQPFYQNFFPFGLAQVSQRRYGRATGFGVGQGLTLGANLSIYIYLVRTYGFSSTQVPRTDGPTVRLLQQIQIGTGVAFLGMYAWGVYDAIRNHKPRIRVDVDDSLRPPGLDEDAPKPPRPTPKKTSFLKRMQLAPMLTGDTVGIGIGWED